MLEVFEKFERRRTNWVAGAGDWRNFKYGNQFYFSDRAGKAADEALRDNAEMASEVLDAVQSIVDALTPPGGGRYVVSYTDNPNQAAGTNLNTRTIRVTSKVLSDPKMKLRDACVVMTGFAVHEIMHTIISPQTEGIINMHWPNNSTVKTVANLLDDVRGDTMQRRIWPGFAPAIRPTLKFIWDQWLREAGSQALRFLPREASLRDRLNFAIYAVRFASFVQWSADDLTREERRWWRSWAALNSTARSDDEVIMALVAAIDHLNEKQLQDEPEPEPQQSEPESDESDGTADVEPQDPADEPDLEDEGDDSEFVDDAQLDTEDDDSEPGDPNDDEGDPNGDPEDDDESQADGDDGDDFDDESDGSEPFEQDAELDPDDDDFEADGVGDSQPSDQTMTDVDPIDTEDLPDIDDLTEEVTAPSLDDFNEESYDDARLQELVMKDREIERVNRSDGFGSMKIRVL